MVERLGEMRKGGRDRVEKGSRERIERKEKVTKGSWDDNLKRRRRNITNSLCLFSFLKAVGTPPNTVPD